jgi:hypothetical protein
VEAGGQITCQDASIKTHWVLGRYKSVLLISWKWGNEELLFWTLSTVTAALEMKTGRKICTVRECRFW